MSPNGIKIENEDEKTFCKLCLEELSAQEIEEMEEMHDQVHRTCKEEFDEYTWKNFQTTEERKKLINWLSKIGYFKKINIDLYSIDQKLQHILTTNSINLAGLNINDIPIEIGSLTNVEQLYLDANAIRKLPDELGKLKYLRVLSLSYNNLHEIPECIGKIYANNMYDHLHPLEHPYSFLETQGGSEKMAKPAV